MGIIPVLVTVLLLVILTLGIRKGYNIITLLFSLSIVALFFWMLLKGLSPLVTAMPNAKPSGSNFFDIFELLVETFKDRFSALLIITMSVIAYTTYMTAIGASKALADVLVKPISKIKNKYLLLSAVVLVVFLMIFAIPSPTSVVMLLFATAVPIMVDIGLPIESIVPALVVTTGIVSGPANPITNFVCKELNILETMDIAQFAFSKQIIIAIICTISLMIFVPLTNKWYDKKDNIQAKPLALNQDVTYKGPKAPGYYAIFPLLPLILIVIFSKLIVGSMTISVVAAQFLCMIVIMFVDKFISSKSLVDAYDVTKNFYKGMGGYIGSQGLIPVAGAMFATTIKLIGGMDIIVSKLANMGLGFVGMMIFAALLAVLCSFITADAMGTSTIVVPVVASIIEKTTGSPVLAACLMIQAAALGSTISMVYPSTLMLSSLTDVKITTIVQRTLIPVIATVIILAVSCFLLF